MKTFLQFLAAIGAGSTALAGADLAGIIHLLPAPWAAVLAVGPPALATVAHAIAAALKGQHKASTFTRGLPVMLAGTAVVMGVALTSCGTIAPMIDAQGCILQSVDTEEGDTYRIGYCPDGRVVAEWDGPEGVDFRATWHRDEDDVQVSYRPDGSANWIPWGAKAGLAPGAPVVVPQ